MDLFKKLSFFIFALCIFISLKNQNTQITNYSRKYSAKTQGLQSSHVYPKSNRNDPKIHATESKIDQTTLRHDFYNDSNIDQTESIRAETMLRYDYYNESNIDATESSRAETIAMFRYDLYNESNVDATELDRAETALRYDYYKESCPFAEEIVRKAVRDAYKDREDVAPAMLRLFFHDCFIEGCDASVLLDPTDEAESEKQSPPNESLRGFDLIDTIKLKLEEACPGVVSCADIVVLAARESVVLTGGPFFPLRTGRRDSNAAFPDVARDEIPSPHEDLSRTIELFAAKGFDERETVTLLGAHSTGMVHCKFFVERLDNFRETGSADPTMDPDFLDILRSKCNQSRDSVSASISSQLSSPSLDASAPSPPISSNRPNEEPAMKMDYEGPRSGFGSVYYRSLLQHQGLLYLDQQLTTGEKTDTWVKAYASDVSLFRKDFTLTMIKLSHFRALTGSMGQVRSNCRVFNS